jgi:hypothetical protein
MKDTAFVRIPAILLAVIALWPLAGAFHWFGVNVATVEQMSRTDPLGLRVFPAALMFLRPTLAAIAALTAVHITWRVLTSHPLRAPRTFINGAGTLVLFAVTLLLTGPAVNSTLTRLLPMFENRRTPGALVLVRQRSTSETDRAAVGAILPSTSGPAPPGCRCRRQDCPTCRRL